MRIRPLLFLIACLLVVLVSTLSLMQPVVAQDTTIIETPTLIPTAAPVGLPGVEDVYYWTPTPTYGCELPLALEIGDYAWIKAGVNVRHIASLSGVPVFYATEATDVVITGGPVCVDGYYWWQVSGTDNPGWVAEGRSDEGQFLIPYDSAIDALCTSIYDIAVGDTVELALNTRVRETAGMDGLVKTIAPAGSMIEIVGGPQCIDGVYWWWVNVSVLDYPYTGWMAQGDQFTTWLIPDDIPSEEEGTLCANPLTLEQGTRALVRYYDGIPKTLRAAPGEDGPSLFTLVNNVPLVIEGGPVCTDNLNWWKVRVLASTEVIGWLAEGSSTGGYWIRPLYDVYPPGPGE